jgi:hypothetical protein
MVTVLAVASLLTNLNSIDGVTPLCGRVIIMAPRAASARTIEYVAPITTDVEIVCTDERIVVVPTLPAYSVPLTVRFANVGLDDVERL